MDLSAAIAIERQWHGRIRNGRLFVSQKCARSSCKRCLFPKRKGDQSDGSTGWCEFAGESGVLVQSALRAALRSAYDWQHNRSSSSLIEVHIYIGIILDDD